MQQLAIYLVLVHLLRIFELLLLKVKLFDAALKCGGYDLAKVSAFLAYPCVFLATSIIGDKHFRYGFECRMLHLLVLGKRGYFEFNRITVFVNNNRRVKIICRDYLFKLIYSIDKFT